MRGNELDNARPDRPTQLFETQLAGFTSRKDQLDETAVSEDVRVRALAAGRADEDAVSLVLGSFEVGSAHRVALTDARAVRFEATAPSPVTRAIASSVSAISSSVAPAASARGGYHLLTLPPATAGRMLAVWGAGDGRVGLPGRRRQRRGLHEAFPAWGRGSLMPRGGTGSPAGFPRGHPHRRPAPRRRRHRQAAGPARQTTAHT